jgi:hypothetical protein
MAGFVFPWRLLGALRVEKGLIRARELEGVRGREREKVWGYDADAPDDSRDLVERYLFQRNAWRGPPR